MFLVFFSSFSASRFFVVFCFICFVLFFSLRLISLVLKSVFVTKFPWANPAAKLFTIKLLNYELVIYLSWSQSVTFFSNFTYFCVIICFLTKLLTSGILFSTAVNLDLAPKPLILGILPSFSVLLVFYLFFRQGH